MRLEQQSHYSRITVWRKGAYIKGTWWTKLPKQLYFSYFAGCFIQFHLKMIFISCNRFIYRYIETWCRSIAKSNILIGHYWSTQVCHCLKVSPGIVNERVPRTHGNSNGNVVSEAINQSVRKINMKSGKHGRPRDESWGHKQRLALWLWCWFLRFCEKKKKNRPILLVPSQEPVSWVYERHFETVCDSTSKSQSLCFQWKSLGLWNIRINQNTFHKHLSQPM